MSDELNYLEVALEQFAKDQYNLKTLRSLMDEISTDMALKKPYPFTSY